MKGIDRLACFYGSMLLLLCQGLLLMRKGVRFSFSRT